MEHDVLVCIVKWLPQDYISIFFNYRIIATNIPYKNNPRNWDERNWKKGENTRFCSSSNWGTEVAGVTEVFSKHEKHATWA
jgi:hypothetical protein